MLCGVWTGYGSTVVGSCRGGWRLLRLVGKNQTTQQKKEVKGSSRPALWISWGAGQVPWDERTKEQSAEWTGGWDVPSVPTEKGGAQRQAGTAETKGTTVGSSSDTTRACSATNDHITDHTIKQQSIVEVSGRRGRRGGGVGLAQGGSGTGKPMCVHMYSASPIPGLPPWPLDSRSSTGEGSGENVKVGVYWDCVAVKSRGLWFTHNFTVPRGEI